MLLAAGAAVLAGDGPPQLRVAKGLGTRDYGTLRISLITQHGEPHKPGSMAWDYSEQFQHRWKQFDLHSSLVEVAGASIGVPLGDGVVANVSLPHQGAGVAGVLIADPCVRRASVTGLAGCFYAGRFQTWDRTPALLNAFVGHPDTDFWGILGDNWYDRTGDTTAIIYDRLGLPTLAKPFVTVPGNHDYWVLGTPSHTQHDLDQYGNGHMQYYAQDTLAGRRAVPGSSTIPPFNFSVDPDAGRSIFESGNLPAIDNSLFYHQMGNVAFIGYSGAYGLDALMPAMREACAWLPTQRGVDWAVLLGHWDFGNLGATPETASPGMYEHVRSLPGCDGFEAKRRLKFVTGHTHCNVPHPHGHNGTGFMVAGQGMVDPGCLDRPDGSRYGVPVFDTTEGRLRFWYFGIDKPIGQPASSDKRVSDRRYDELIGCVRQGGWRSCTHLAELWLDQPLSP